MEKSIYSPQFKDSHFFIDSSINMCLAKNPDWDPNGNCGLGDALWRTGLAYITWKDPSLKQGIMSCFTEKNIEIKNIFTKIYGFFYKLITKKHYKKIKTYLQAHRAPNYGAENVSRDQITSALCALKLNQDYKELNYILKGLSWKISNKFKLIPEMKWWMNSLNGSIFYGVVFAISSMITMSLGCLWNKILYKWAGVKKVSREHISSDNYSGENLPKKVEKAYDYHYPAYAFHLFAWQLYTSPDNIFKKLTQKIALRFTEPHNYLLKLLFGDRVKIQDLLTYKPSKILDWQTYVQIPRKEPLYFLKGDELKYNVLNRDVMIEIVARNKNLLIEKIAVLSDVHIGREDSNCKECLNFLKENKYEIIILNGDIFDIFARLKNSSLYKNTHKKVVKEFLEWRKSNKDIQVYYLIGNHDYHYYLLKPISFLWKIKIRKKLKFDDIIIRHGDWIKYILWIKKLLDKNIRIVKEYPENCLTYAKLKNKRIIVGHSHKPKIIEDKVFDCGDWVINNTIMEIIGNEINLRKSS